jgi:hypothetical protein
VGILLVSKSLVNEVGSLRIDMGNPSLNRNIILLIDTSNMEEIW